MREGRKERRREGGKGGRESWNQSIFAIFDYK